MARRWSAPERGHAVGAACLFTELDGIVQAHLAGTNEDLRHLSPLKVLLDDARSWARSRGDHVLHLGGGRARKEDYLFAFKARFSPRRHAFHTGRWILEPRSTASSSRRAGAHCALATRRGRDTSPPVGLGQPVRRRGSARTGLADPEDGAVMMGNEGQTRETFYRRRGKRLLDLVLAVPALAVAMPAIGLVSVGVAAALGRPVIFAQERPGLGGRTFRFYKFRTMTSERDSAGELKPDDERFTGFGRVLRTLSLDELPQLWHVVRGDMSLVGPRPLLVEYLDRYSPRQARRHEVLPGITGWAQVNGRNALTWEQKFEYDVWYVDNVSLAVDIRILLKTLASVACRRGITPADSASVPVFRGSKL